MPESKARHPHKHPHHHNGTPGTHQKPKKITRIVIIAGVFFALLGLGISYLLNASSTAALLAGPILGGIAGCIFGYQVDKTLSKK
jgi:hypothetical protein